MVGRNVDWELGLCTQEKLSFTMTRNYEMMSKTIKSKPCVILLRNMMITEETAGFDNGHLWG